MFDGSPGQLRRRLKPSHVEAWCCIHQKIGCPDKEDDYDCSKRPIVLLCAERMNKNVLMVVCGANSGCPSGLLHCSQQ